MLWHRVKAMYESFTFYFYITIAITYASHKSIIVFINIFCVDSIALT